LLFKIGNPVRELGLFFEIFTVLARLTAFDLSLKQLSLEFGFDFSHVQNVFFVCDLSFELIDVFCVRVNC